MLAVDEETGDTLEPEPSRRAPRRAEDHLIHRDNTYGTPEEDAFRRDFTVNALFYDIGTFSIIDYTGGLRDLDARLIRCIGDPEVRFLEDPVRMLRAVVLAARLEFRIDDASLDAIERQKHEIARSAAPRLLEEYYKILRSGHSAEASASSLAPGCCARSRRSSRTPPTRSGTASSRSTGIVKCSTRRPIR